MKKLHIIATGIFSFLILIVIMVFFTYKTWGSYSLPMKLVCDGIVNGEYRRGDVSSGTDVMLNPSDSEYYGCWKRENNGMSYNQFTNNEGCVE